MKIILVRHGKPDIDTATRLSMSEMARWIQDYETSVVREPCPDPLRALPGEGALVIVASDLPRAMTSLEAMGRSPESVDALYREAPLPALSLSWPRLSPLTNAFLLRVLWLLGYARGVESCPAAGRRAKSAALRLISLTEGGSPVLLMGHGIMNRLIGRQLKKAGFSQTLNLGKGYWRADVYTRRASGSPRAGL